MATNLSDEELSNQLQQFRSQLNKKQTFESAVSSIKSLLLQSYSTASPPTKKIFYDVVNRVATVLRTRYTFPAYLLAGAELLEIADRLTVDAAEKSHLKSCISHFRETLTQQCEGEETSRTSNRSGRYLFEGHLTVDQEPPQPNWLVQQNLLTALAASQTENNNNNNDDHNGENIRENLMMGLVESLDMSMIENLDALLPSMEEGGRAAPPASKKVVEKLPVIKLESEAMVKEKTGEEEGAECCICKEKLGVGDEMQEMPCKHMFHPPCLKPWLDEHNSCPICRHELPTDDHKYESWKEREKELEEERRGAANALPGGEFMYI